ncbi:glycyl-radical enzyme activating protein [Aedoeadaptatus urinae]|uniref:glycyl-radical enzyme activating protein n=1 Tax=Aedoeadaptatus urinae TaxID=1871017 RepID=UPI00097D43B0|nr:glycyl-radical enzyme activating protein [Peptoniphilus urinae]
MGTAGYVMQLQPFSVNDGDGIRTTVFMAGCPLRCQWCANPEGLENQIKIGWYERKCIGCGKCVEACPKDIGIDLNKERDRCIACGRCTEVCPTGARAYMVRKVDSDDIVEALKKDRLFYAMSGGGVTFSGGEPTAQPDFLNEVTKEIYDLGYSLAIETSGHFDFDAVKPSLERMDMIFMDLKHVDPALHKEYTGVSNERILENMARLQELNGDVVIRIPVIGGVNDEEAIIRRAARFVREKVPKAEMELLPYHPFGMIKYEAIGAAFDQSAFYRPSDEKMDRLRRTVREESVSLADFR